MCRSDYQDGGGEVGMNDELLEKLDKLQDMIYELSQTFFEMSFRNEAEKTPILPIGDGKGNLFCGNHPKRRIVVGGVADDGTILTYCQQCPVCGRKVNWDG